MTANEVVYGYPPNDLDPRDFTPDDAACTATELRAWELACEQAAEGRMWASPRAAGEVRVGGRVVDPAVTPAGSWWGIGTYRAPMEGADGAA